MRDQAGGLGDFGVSRPDEGHNFNPLGGALEHLKAVALSGEGEGRAVEIG